MHTLFREDRRAGCGGAWQARSGAAVLIRPICAADFPILRKFVRTFSPQTRYERFLSPHDPDDEELRQWTAIDPAHAFSLVAVDHAPDDALVGEARYVIEPDGAADVAIVIGDRWRGQGLGNELMTRLICAARCDGLSRLTADALSTNSAVLALARKLGFRVSRSAGAAFLSRLTLDLRS